MDPRILNNFTKLNPVVLKTHGILKIHELEVNHFNIRNIPEDGYFKIVATMDDGLTNPADASRHHDDPSDIFRIMICHGSFDDFKIVFKRIIVSGSEVLSTYKFCGRYALIITYRSALYKDKTCILNLRTGKLFKLSDAYIFDSATPSNDGEHLALYFFILTDAKFEFSLRILSLDKLGIIETSQTIYQFTSCADFNYDQGLILFFVASNEMQNQIVQHEYKLVNFRSQQILETKIVQFTHYLSGYTIHPTLPKIIFGPDGYHLSVI